MKGKITNWLLKRIFGKLTSCESCANRAYWIYINGDFEYKIVRRQTTIPDMYSREERYRMAQILREEAARDGWDVFSCFDSPTSLE